jgi:hypothetical protein
MTTIYMESIAVVKEKNAPGEQPEKFSFLGED